MMNTYYQDIRSKATEDGYEIDDKSFSKLVEYARRKATISGRDESYLPFLLPDVIKEWHIGRAVNTYSIAMMQIQNIF